MSEQSTDPKTAQHISCHSEHVEFFQSYHRDALKQTAVTDYINGWQIDYLAFFDETYHNHEQPPIVILSGAFQQFNSYKYFMAGLLKTAPVLLIDLPSTGSNTQIENVHLNQHANVLSMPDLADLLHLWFEQVGIKKVSIMGMSLGSVVATNFASRYQENMHRLVLMGIMRRTRQSWRMLIEASLVELDKNHMSEFGEAVVLYLVNHAKLEQTRMSSLAIKLFHQQIAGFNDNEKLRYHINAHRLLSIDEIPVPQCPTIIVTGEYDSFTLPYENAQFAQACPDARYIMVENADHVLQLQRRRETSALFDTFLANQPIDDLKGIRPVLAEDIATLERRSDERIVLHEPVALVHQAGKRSDEVIMVDVNFFGALFSVETIEQASFIYAESREMQLVIHDEIGSFTIDLLLFEQDIRHIRALFKHQSFKQAERWKTYLQHKQIIDNDTYLQLG